LLVQRAGIELLGRQAGDHEPRVGTLAQVFRLADQGGPQRIMPQLVVVVEIFVAQSQAKDSLPQQLLDRMFDQFFIAIISETAGQLPDDARLLLDLPQQQPTGIGGDRPPSKRATTSRRPRPWNSNVCWVHCRLLGTLCLHRLPPCYWHKSC